MEVIKMMQVATSRFGQVDFKESDVLDFSEGLLGFTDLKKFVIVDDPDDEIFMWLQSLEKPEVAFPVLEPEFFIPKYKIGLNKVDFEILGAKNENMISSLKYLCIVTIPTDVTHMSANLKAPLVFNMTSRKGKQVVASENDLQIKFPIFAELQRRFVQNPQTNL